MPSELKREGDGIVDKKNKKPKRSDSNAEIPWTTPQ
jgi:hypothetical protein